MKAVEQIEGAPDSRIVLICDHASNAVPPEMGALGLPPSAFARHIAYDIGAAGATRLMAAALEAPAILSCFSRLVIDPNRGADDPTLVMRISDGALIPGNARLSAEDVEQRRRNLWLPYRQAIADRLALIRARGAVPIVVSVHSMTENWKGSLRPWQFSVLWDKDPRLAVPLMRNLREAGLRVGDNEPYDGALKGDTLYDLATSQGYPHVLIEFRQDLIGSPEGIAHWAQVCLAALRPALGAPELNQVRHFGSRAG